MKNLYKISLMIGTLIVSMFFGYTVNKAYVQRPIPVLSDILPLKNQGNITIKLIENKKLVIMFFEDFQYVVKKKKRSKKAVRDLESLFKRLEGHK